MTDFSELEAHPGNRDFERVNALVCMGWEGTDSAKVQAEPTAELFIAEDKSFVECTWTAGFSLNSGSYEFYGEGETYTGEDHAVEKYDTSSLEGGLQVAVRILEELLGIDQVESARKIVRQLQENNPE